MLARVAPLACQAFVPAPINVLFTPSSPAERSPPGPGQPPYSRRARRGRVRQRAVLARRRHAAEASIEAGPTTQPNSLPFRPDTRPLSYIIGNTSFPPSPRTRYMFAGSEASDMLPPYTPEVTEHVVTCASMPARASLFSLPSPPPQHTVLLPIFISCCPSAPSYNPRPFSIRVLSDNYPSGALPPVY